MLQLLFFHTLLHSLLGKTITKLDNLIVRKIDVDHFRFISENNIH